MTMIPMLDLRAEYLHIKAAIDEKIANCLEHHRWILGPEVDNLEANVAEYLNANHCVGVSSGTDALIIALRALAIRDKQQEFFSKEDKIITTPFTFTATGSSILHAGATPVWVDIDPVTFNLDPEQVKRAVEEIPGIVGILPVHLFGQSADMGAIMEIAEQYNLFVVEDVAQGFGAKWNDKQLSTIGDIGTFSFFPSKNLGGFGDGGAIATQNAELAELSRMLMQHGGKDKNNVDHLGYNARLDALQAAIINAKLDHIDDFNNHRRAIAHAYNEGFAGIAEIETPREDGIADKADVHHIYHQYTLRVKNGQRDALKAHLAEQGVSSMVYYPHPLHTMRLFKETSECFGNLEHTEQAAKEVLSLPVEPLQSAETIETICQSVRSFFK